MNKKIKILYLQYVAGDAALADKILTRAGINCEMLPVSEKKSFLTALNSFTPDIIISDDALKLLNTTDALTLLRQGGFNIPLIAVTIPPLINPTRSVANIMKSGACDYLAKGQINNLSDAILDALKKHRAEKITNHDLSRYINTIDEVFFSIDMLKYELLQISAGCESVYGYSPAEFLEDGELHAKVYHPDDRHLQYDLIARLQTGELVVRKYRVIHKNKSIRWIESKITPILNDAGILIRIEGVSRNITQAKIAEDALKASESRYRQIVETAQEGIWIIDENLATVFVNKKMCDMLGYTAEEIIGKHNYDFKNEEEKLKTLARFEKEQLGTIETHESAFITKNGEQIFCIVVTNDLFDADGKYLGKLGMLTDITQRKKDEDELRRSRANISAIIENTSDLVYSIDRNFDFITYNQPFKNAMKLVYNFDLDYETNTLSLINGLPTEVAEKWMGIYNKAFDGETIQFVNEYPFGGTIIYLSYSVNPIWESGKVIGLSCFSRDITRQKLDEAAIKKSAANLTAIIESSDAGIYSVDADLNCIIFNKLFSQKLRETYNVELCPGDSILDFLKEIEPDQAKEWEKMYGRALSGEVIQFVKEWQIDGVTSFVNFSINPIWENDVVTGLSCSGRDITRQKTDELAVRKSEASLRTIFNNTDMACLLIDTGGNIISFNTLAKKFMNEQSNIVIKEGYPILDCVDENRKSLVSDILNKTKNGTGINYQLSRETNGIVKWFDLTWAGIKDSKMQDFGHVFTVRDITEKKKLETEREKITADLIQRNKALEQFTYIISHNLRAPVANIIGLSSLISSAGIESDELPEVIKSIGRSANKLDGVILDLNQILQVNEDINENIQQIFLPKLIEDIKFSVRHMVEKEHATIVFDFGEATEMLSVKSFIHSIFYNLILNSIKYRKPGTDPVININAKAKSGKIQIVYKDNGRGIDTSKYANELFGLYKRFDTSVEGKGIGLFMVKMQVESLGGTILLQSELNKGTEFKLEFPQAQLQTA